MKTKGALVWDFHQPWSAALVSRRVTTGWGSATRAAAVRPGEDVVVVGLGGSECRRYMAR